MADELRASWGIRSSTEGIGEGVVVGIDMRTEASVVTETDDIGAQCAAILYDYTMAADIDIMVGATQYGPMVGEQIKVTDKGMLYVTSVQVVEQNQAYKKLHVSAAGSRLVKEAIDATDTASEGSK